MRERIDAFIGAGTAAGFEELALEVFAYQYARHELYRRYCAARGASPGSVRDWQQVPAIPVDAFKHGLIAETDQPFLFLSSGTTAGADSRSRHPLATLQTYRACALAHFADMVLPDRPGPLATLVLGPTAQTHPYSSLGAMFSWCVESYGAPGSQTSLDESGQADIDAAIAWLEAHSRGSTPVMILALTSALSALFAELRRRKLVLRLPADSRLVDTGGRKLGSPGTHVLSAQGVLKAAWRFLHVPAYSCVNEYGMTEMVSQFYDDALRSRTHGHLSRRAKVGPHWVRTRVIDPVSMAPAAAGATGILAHVDLANWETVSFLQTADLGREIGAGFELMGRVTGAAERGCSQLLAELVVGAEADRGAPGP